MNDNYISTFAIIKPRLIQSWRYGRKLDLLSQIKLLAFTLFGAFFWLIIYYFSYSVIKKMASEPIFGEILTQKLISFLFTLFFAVLTFSNVISALSNYFLSDDNEFLAASPVPIERFYVARFIETMLQTSWMLLIFALPVLIAAGHVWRAPVGYFFWLIPTLAFFLLIPAALGIFITLFLVRAFPAKKAQDVLIALAAVFIVAMYVIFRFLRPERLFNPDILLGVTEYLAALKTPDQLIAPSQWATSTITEALTGNFKSALLPLSLLLSNGLLFALIVDWACIKMYPTAFAKAIEGKRAGISRALWRLEPDQKVGLSKAFFRKEIVGFVRETSQWTQLLLIVGLVAIYLYNFRILNLERIAGLSYYLINLICYVNIVLAAMVVIAVAARFALPAVSLEGQAFWVIKSAPITTGRFLWEKMRFYWPPLFLLGEILVVVTNRLMHADSLVSYLGFVTMIFLSLGITGLAIGIGAIFPNFKEHNPAKISTSSTSVLFMITAAGYAIISVVIEYFPARAALFAQLSNEALSLKDILLAVAASIAIAGLTLMAVILPIRTGIKKLESLENI